MAVIAITDIHGRYDCLEALCEKIDKHLQAEVGRGKHKVIVLGDSIDRGPDSKRVVDSLMAGTKYFTFADEVVSLMGNHEEMYLKALYRGNWDMFLSNGGVATMMSFMECSKHKLFQIFESDDGILSLRDNYPMLEDYANYFKKLPLFHVDGKYAFVHAGLPIGRSVEEVARDPEGHRNSLLWIRDAFLRLKCPDPNYIVVHGHTPHDFDPYRDHVPRRINLDAGSCWTGILQAAVIPDTAFDDYVESLKVELPPGIVK